MTEHTILTSAQSHEPKHISTSVTGDSGKVITPSSTVAGTSDIRSLIPSEVGVTTTDYLRHHGEMEIIQNSTVDTITVATDATLYTAGDYQQITANWTAGTVNGITHSSGELTVPVDGVYLLSCWNNITFSVNNTLVGFKFTINGSVTSPASTPTVRRKIGTGTDVGSIAASGLIQLSATNRIGIAAAASNGGDLTITDGVCLLQLIKAL